MTKLYSSIAYSRWRRLYCLSGYHLNQPPACGPVPCLAVWATTSPLRRLRAHAQQRARGARDTVGRYPLTSPNNADSVAAFVPSRGARRLVLKTFAIDAGVLCLKWLSITTGSDERNRLLYRV